MPSSKISSRRIRRRREKWCPEREADDQLRSGLKIHEQVSIHHPFLSSPPILHLAICTCVPTSFCLDLVSPKVLPSYQCSDYSPLEFGNLPSTAVSLSLVHLEPSEAECSFPHYTYPLPEEPLVASFFRFFAKEQSESFGPHHMLATALAALA